MSLNDPLAAQLREELIELRPPFSHHVAGDTQCRGGIELADRLLLSLSSARILADLPVARPRVPHTAAELEALRKETARQLNQGLL